MRSHIGSPKAMAPVDFRRFAGGSHSVAKQALFSIAFGTDFGGFGEPNWTRKSSFEALFFDVFSECVSLSILVRFLEARDLKNVDFA